MKSLFKGLGSDPKYERWRWQMFAVTWLGYAGFYLTRKSFSIAKTGMGEETEVGLLDTEMAWIDMGYLIAYAIGQFVWGITADKVGPRKVLLGGMLISILTGVAMGVSTLPLALGVFFFIQGLCQSTGWAPLTKNVSNFFSQRERGTIMGMWCTNYAVGGVVASALAAWAATQWGYQYAFFVPAGVLLCIWFLFVFCQRNRPEDVGLPPIEEYHDEQKEAGEEPDHEEGQSWSNVISVLKDPMVRMLAGVYFFLKPTRYAILFWGPVYITEKLGTRGEETGYMDGAIATLFELAGPLSVLIAGIMTDKVFGSRRMPVAVTCLLSLSVLLFMLDDLPANRYALGAGFFMIGILLYAPDSLISGTAAVDFGTRKGAGTAAGMINGCGSFGAVLGGALPGFVKEQWGWDGIFLALSISILIAGLLLLPQWNKLPKSHNKPQTP